MTRVPDRVWVLEGNISSGRPVWFNEGDIIPAGYYTIRYVNGAFKLGSADGWGVTSKWMMVNAIPGGMADMFSPPCSGVPGPPTLPKAVYPGVGYDSQEAAENAAKSEPSKFFYYRGGSLGLVLYLDDYTNNTPGDPSPTWELIHYKEAVDGSGSSSGSGATTGSTGGSTGGSEPTECAVTGLLSPEYKTLIDSLPTHPGGFGFVFAPGVYITAEDGVDSVLDGDIEFRSYSLDITCERGVEGDTSRNVFTFSVNDDFLSTFCVEIKGQKGPTGEKGNKGKQGRHGTGDGPAGLTGPKGTDATSVHKFTGIKIVESDDIYDTAVVDLLLDPKSCTLEVVKAKMAVPDNDEPAVRVTASPIFRDVRFPTYTLDVWELVSPLDTASNTQTADIDIIKLPAGWNGQVTGAVPVVTMKLSQLIQLIIDYYKGRADKITAKWDKEIENYIASKDKEARTILADLAMELTECEWSLPIDFCIDIEPIPCR